MKRSRGLLEEVLQLHSDRAHRLDLLLAELDELLFRPLVLWKVSHPPLPLWFDSSINVINAQIFVSYELKVWIRTLLFVKGARLLIVQTFSQQRREKSSCTQRFKGRPFIFTKPHFKCWGGGAGFWTDFTSPQLKLLESFKTKNVTNMTRTNSVWSSSHLNPEKNGGNHSSQWLSSFTNQQFRVSYFCITQHAFLLFLYFHHGRPRRSCRISDFTSSLRRPWCLGGLSKNYIKSKQEEGLNTEFQNKAHSFHI